MAENWTPVTEVVKDACTFHRNRLGEPRTIAPEAFDRWLAKVKANALREAATGLIDWDVLYGHEIGSVGQRESNRNAYWLTSEADRIEKEATA